MNYIISVLVMNYVYNYSKKKGIEYLKYKTLYYSWYTFKFPFVWMYNFCATKKDIDDDYEMVEIEHKTD